MQNDIEKRFEMVKSSTTFERISKTYTLKDKRVLDMGCGYGEYMQRFGKNSVGITTTQAEVDFGKENNIDIRFGNVELLEDIMTAQEEFDVFWGNNLFEHLLSPHAFLVNLKHYAKDNSILILGVPMVPRLYWLTRIPKFRGSLASPHINFFTKETFRLTAERAGWSVIEIRSFAFKSSIFDKITNIFMPHLYLVAKNNASYIYPPKKVKEWEDDPHYASLLSLMGHKHK